MKRFIKYSTLFLGGVFAFWLAACGVELMAEAAAWNPVLIAFPLGGLFLLLGLWAGLE